MLQNAGLCWLWQNTQGPGSWKKFMVKDQQQGSVVPIATQTPGSGQVKQQKPLPQQQVAEITTTKPQNTGLLSQIGKLIFVISLIYLK